MEQNESLEITRAGKQHRNKGVILDIYPLLTDCFKREKWGSRFLSSWAWWNG